MKVIKRQMQSGYRLKLMHAVLKARFFTIFLFISDNTYSAVGENCWVGSVKLLSHCKDSI